VAVEAVSLNRLKPPTKSSFTPTSRSPWTERWPVASRGVTSFINNNTASTGIDSLHNCKDITINISINIEEKGAIDEMPILTAFIEAAMQTIQYVCLTDKTVYGKIPDCSGVWGEGSNQQECKKDIQEALEIWLLLKLKDNDSIPIINGIDLNEVVEKIVVPELE
jgi:predicted RNase H-like HicB family nuclease